MPECRPRIRGLYFDYVPNKEAKAGQVAEVELLTKRHLFRQL